MPKGLKGNKKTKNKSKDKMYKRLGIWVKEQTKTIDILGTKYIVKFQYGKGDSQYNTCDGYCDVTIHTLVVFKVDTYPDTVQDLNEFYKKVLRHEVIHAFIYESGLHCNSVSCGCWSENEEMVDWFAIQSPKVFEVFKKLGIL